MIYRIVLILFVLSLTIAANGQPPEPLIGPLVATTPATTDHFHIHDLGSGQTRALSFGYGEHHVWDFSPDGCRVLFTLDESDNGLPTLYSARLDGSDQQAMVIYDEQPADTWGVWEPQWSPQGIIAFTMIRDEVYNDGTRNREHYIARINGFASSEATFYSVTGREFTPQWSPDGAWLAYVSYDRRLPGADIFSTAVPTTEPTETQDEQTLLEEADLWIVSADGGTKYRLTAFSVGSVRSPRWSPDGALIGFIYSPTGNSDTFWIIANNQGAIPTQLSFQWNLTLDHTWLPDSSAMISAVRDFRDVRENRMWRIPLIGNADNDATLYLDNQEFIHTDFPRFSADGRYLAFRNAYALAVIDTEDNTWQRFDEGAPGNTSPVWTPATFNGEANCQTVE
jgi:Tol biopolymer transport system component